MKFFAGLLAGIVLVAVAAVGFAYSGWYNVAATRPHVQPVSWIFSTTMENSVSAHAEGIVPPDLTDEMAQAGAGHFTEMCAPCHGGPGVEPSEMGKGLRPTAPALSEAAREWSPAELFWIVKNGVRFTGMPAWGVSHEDPELWKVVAFVEKLPDMSPAEYEEISQSTSHGHGGSDAGHSHDTSEEEGHSRDGSHSTDHPHGG